jgi:mannose/fructose/N-acetylgalactosamine-specific phosphotransferase system component IIB
MMKVRPHKRFSRSQSWIRPYKQTAPDRYKGSRIRVLAKSVNEVKRACEGISGIIKIRCGGSSSKDGLRVVEIVHSLYSGRLGKLYLTLREKFKFLYEVW